MENSDGSLGLGLILSVEAGHGGLPGGPGTAPNCPLSSKPFLLPPLGPGFLRAVYSIGQLT